MLVPMELMTSRSSVNNPSISTINANMPSTQNSISLRFWLLSIRLKNRMINMSDVTTVIAAHSSYIRPRLNMLPLSESKMTKKHQTMVSTGMRYLKTLFNTAYIFTNQGSLPGPNTMVLY